MKVREGEIMWSALFILAVVMGLSAMHWKVQAERAQRALVDCEEGLRR